MRLYSERLVFGVKVKLRNAWVCYVNVESLFSIFSGILFLLVMMMNGELFLWHE